MILGLLLAHFNVSFHCFELLAAGEAHGQHRTSNELRKLGVFVSGSGVRSIWLRHNLENFKKRLKALEEKVASEGIILSDAQVAALEKKKHDDEACGEIEPHIQATLAPKIPSMSAT